MDIPLVLQVRKDGKTVYAIPLWYRLAMVAIGAVLVGAILVSGGSPSVLEWVALAIVAAAALYEERWTLDPATSFLSHRYGLLFLARSITLPFSRIEGFRLRAFIRGSAPGGPSEAEDNARILAAVDPANDSNALREGRRSLRKAYVSLVCDDLEGGGMVVNTLPARRAAELRKAGAILAQVSGKRFEAS